MMVGRFVEVCRRRGLKVNADKNKVMMRGDWGVRFMWIGLDWSKCQSSNILGVFWMNQMQMIPNVVEG